MAEIIKKGEICLYSTVREGLVKVKYMGESRIVPHSDDYIYRFKFMQEWADMKKGDEMWLRKTFITPKRLCRKTGMFSYICTSEFEFELNNE